MDGAATPAQIGGMLMAMRARGETVAELTGAVTAMRRRMTPVAAPANAMDVCGTGGDGAASLNVSTAVTFVLAACGIPVAKHGNRALSSRAGGADVLAALGREYRARTCRVCRRFCARRGACSCSRRAIIRPCAMRRRRGWSWARARSSI